MREEPGWRVYFRQSREAAARGDRFEAVVLMALAVAKRVGKVEALAVLCEGFLRSEKSIDEATE